MQWSHSRIECFEKCLFKYKMRYLDGIKTIPDTAADNALILGTVVHTGIQKGIEAALQEYAFSFPIIGDEHIHEMMKLEAVIPKVQAALPSDGEFEVPIIGTDFIGFIDYLLPVGENEFDIYDFKYTAKPANYKTSPQLSLYKYFFERYNPGKKIRKLYFLFVPKVTTKQKQYEDLQQYRDRLKDLLSVQNIQISEQQFSTDAVITFLLTIRQAERTTEFPQVKGRTCRTCEYVDYCEKGWDYFMKLPDNKRRTLESETKRKIWIYGAPFSGKTTFANGFPEPLMINTDGNIKYVDAPYIYIKDEVKVEGRITKRTLAWEIFKEVISELEKKENTFKTIVVDLVEDLYEHCRLYMYQQMGITHESDDSFRAWDKVRGEFLNTLKRLMNLDYENIILISHEDTTKDITKKGGDKITAIKPNLQDKVAIKVAGMVDVVARIVADGVSRTFCFKSNEVIFGGGRLQVTAEDIPLDVNTLFAVYDTANHNTTNGSKQKSSKTTKKLTETQNETNSEQMAEDMPVQETPAESEKQPRKQKTAEPEQEEIPFEVNNLFERCPDSERIFKQNQDSKGEIPLCPSIDAGGFCHKYDDPTDCPLLNKKEEGAEETTEEKPQPRKRRKERN